MAILCKVLIALMVFNCLTVRTGTANEISAQDQSYNEIVFRELTKLRADMDKQAAEVRSTTYVRWGRTRCDGDAAVLYRGYAAGTHWNERGSGANVLCLHEEPQYSRHLSGQQGYVAVIHGVEYQMWDEQNNVFSYANNNAKPLTDRPAPCVVCHIQRRSTTVMIPARVECPAGWTKEYGGYIGTERSLHHRSTFNCWDGAPETAAGGINQDQATICPTEIRCGTLPCAKYADGLELTCVVCSK